MNRRIILVATIMMLASTVQGQQLLTLDQCRQRALDANKGLKMSEEKCNETANLKNVALCQMLPKVGAVGGYVWTDKSVNLLSDDQKERISHIGDQVQSDISASLHHDLGNLPIGGEAIADALSNALGNTSLGTNLNNMGNDVVQGLETDTRNMGIGLVSVTQPIYMGGKLRALYRSAQLADRLSNVEYDKKREETLIAVDEAYWQVVSVKQKKALAEQYADLLKQLTENVEEMVKAEVATNGDLAKVKVKYNEAQMSLTKATNGLALAKMLLAQRCGMPLDSDFDVSDMAPGISIESTDNIDMEQVWQRRHEMQMLRISDSVAQQAVVMAASSLKPNVMAMGGYMFSNPNVFNGFQNEFGGTMTAGVVVNIPILHPGGIYSVKAAKAKQREVAYQREEAQEMIELQVSKLNYERELAFKKLDEAQSNLQQAVENMKLADESFKAGVCSSSDLMTAQTAWMQAKSEVLDAEIEIQMSSVYLQQAMGK